MLYEILLIFICMFAALGIVEVAFYIFNRHCARRLPHRCNILVEDVAEPEAESVIRYLETLISVSGIDCSVCGIRLGVGVQISPEVLLRLQREYGNITFIGDGAK